jgi:hypothetical protein
MITKDMLFKDRFIQLNRLITALRIRDSQAVHLIQKICYLHKIWKNNLDHQHEPKHVKTLRIGLQDSYLNDIPSSRISGHLLQ